MRAQDIYLPALRPYLRHRYFQSVTFLGAPLNESGSRDEAGNAAVKGVLEVCYLQDCSVTWLTHVASVGLQKIDYLDRR